MRLVYSTQPDKFRADSQYENPKFFEKLNNNTAKYNEIILVGEWPKIEEALDAAGFSWTHAESEDDYIATYDNVRTREKGTNVKPSSPPVLPGGMSPSSEIDIPEDWETMKWPELRVLANNFTSDVVVRKDQAIALIRAELDRREED